jgi:hypothetical protein
VSGTLRRRSKRRLTKRRHQDQAPVPPVKTSHARDFIEAIFEVQEKY